MKKLITLILLGFSFSVMAADAQFLADQHIAKGQNCTACHGDKAPAKGATVGTATCIQCHQSLESVDKSMKAKGYQVVPNPHVNHQIGLNCDECHRGHGKMTNSCSDCHVFTFKRQ